MCFRIINVLYFIMAKYFKIQAKLLIVGYDPLKRDPLHPKGDPALKHQIFQPTFKVKGDTRLDLHPFIKAVDDLR